MTTSGTSAASLHLDLVAVLLATILAVALLIAFVVIATVYRRASRSKRYNVMDEHRDENIGKLKEYLESGASRNRLAEFRAPVGSVRWQAIEDNLFGLMDDARFEDETKNLFVELGYLDHYVNKLHSKNIITKATAIDKLGKMRCGQSEGKLVGLLKDGNPEIVTVTVRSLSKIGSPVALQSILEELPNLLSKSLVSMKTIETSLVNFGTGSIPSLIRFGETYDDSMCQWLILDILSSLNAREAAPLALARLEHRDPEVRSRAARLIGTVGGELRDAEKNRLIALLADTVWFVRLQAAKALGSLRHEKAIDNLGDALLDQNWQVRNAAAMALTSFGNLSINVILGTLEYEDRYAKESICEEIQRTNFIDLLIENMASRGTEVYDKSRQVIRIMKSINYWTPLFEYLRTGTNDNIKAELQDILNKESAP